MCIFVLECKTETNFLLLSVSISLAKKYLICELYLWTVFYKNYLPANCLRSITHDTSILSVILLMSWLLEDGVPNFFINSWELFQSRQSLQEKEVSAVEQNTATADQRYQIYWYHYIEFFQKNAQLCNKASCCIPDLVTPYKSDFCLIFCCQMRSVSKV